MIIQHNICIYLENLSRAFVSASLSVPDETPLGKVTEDIREMISSYLTDASSFKDKNDLVNEYASLAYAHGWFDAAQYLGYMKGISPSLFLPDDSCFPPEQQEKLKEKSLRYEKMLKMAVQSLDIASESGSPLYQAGITIKNKSEKILLTCCQETTSDGIYAANLGRISYEYGWLDTGLRAGLYRILAHPELFTTESNRIL